MKPPASDRSTPLFGSASRTREIGDGDAGSAIDSAPAAVGERNDDVECQERAAGARQQHLRRRPVDQRHRLTVEAGFANHQPGWDLQARPALAEHVDCQNRTASDRFCVDAQIVVEARQRRVDRRRRDWRGEDSRARAARDIRRREERPSHRAAQVFARLRSRSQRHTPTPIETRRARPICSLLPVRHRETAGGSFR